jgi:hypothetical protein
LSLSEILALSALVLIPLALVLALVWRPGRRGPARPGASEPRTVMLATQAARQVAPVRFVAKGVITHLAVAAMGFLRALLKPEGRSALLEVEADGRPLQMVAQDGHYVLDVRFQEAPPAGYPAGARVEVTPPGKPVRIDLVVEGGGLAVTGAGPAFLVAQPGDHVGTSFKVRAVVPGKTKLRIDCYHENAWMQTLDFDLEVRPQADLEGLEKEAGQAGETAGATPLSGLESALTLPAPPPDPQPRHLHLSLAYAPDASTGATYRARARMDSEESWRGLGVRVSEQDLRGLNQQLREVLQVLANLLSDQIHIERNEIGAESYDDALDRLARRGNATFKTLFPDAADQRYLIEALASPDGANLEIGTDSFFLPWELLYDSYDPATVDFKSFWGFRHRIVRSLTEPRDQPAALLADGERPRVILFANPGLQSVVEEEVPFLARLDQEKRIELHDGQGEALLARDGISDRERRGRFFEYSRSQPGDLTHFACHALGAESSFESYLELSDDFRLHIEDMLVENYQLAGAPLVLLNACGTGVRDPLKTCDFVRRFLASGGRGVVATECDVPDLFASTFIQRLYDRLLQGEPVASALFESRRSFLAENGNPLGLMYSAYLPFEMRLRR